MSCTIIPSGQETNQQYHCSGSWGSSLVSTFIKSPQLAHQMITGKYRMPETAAMKLGSRFHELLDPDSGFDKRYRCGPDVDRRTKAWLSAEAEAKESGVDLIFYDDWQTLHAMADSVRANPYARSLLEGAEHEVGFRMQSPFGDFKIQARADALHRGSNIIDLKTTVDVDDFASSVRTYSYYRQAALYRWLIHKACGEWLSWSFVVVEKSVLYRCRVFDISPEYMDLGWRDVEAALIDIGKRTVSGNWSDPDHGMIELPVWHNRLSA